VGEANGRIFEMLWSKVDVDNWTNESLRKQFPEWQADFLLASMHAGLTENLGRFQALVISTRGNELQELAASWERIGAWKLANAIRRVGNIANAKGWKPHQQDLDDLPRAVQIELEAYLESQPLETTSELTVLQFSYYNEAFMRAQSNMLSRLEESSEDEEPAPADEAFGEP
jgi:hypothetical protein